jgi:hypothetical protein
VYQQQDQAAAVWRLTVHVRSRAVERGVTEEEILRVVEHPERIYDQMGYGRNRQVRQRGDLGVVVDRCTHAVITVVFRNPADWRPDVDAGDAA